VYGHISGSEQSELNGTSSTRGWQLTNSGQVESCSHPQPQSLPKYDVLEGHEKSIRAHLSGLVATYLRLYSLAGEHAESTQLMVLPQSERV